MSLATISTHPMQGIGHGRHLIGRSEELNHLRFRLATHDSGDGVLVVSGDAGLGTTSLLTAGVAEARERGFPVIRLTLLPGGARVEGSSVRRVIAAAHRIGGPAGIRAPGCGGDLLDAVTRAVDRLSRSAPVCIVLDDAHWIDPLSESILLGLLQRADLRAPLLIAGRSGPGDAFAPHPEIRLRPLTEADAALLLRQQPEYESLSPALRSRILSDADGNPLALTELPRCWLRPDRPGADLVHRFPPVNARLAAAFTRGLDRLPREAAAALLLTALSSRDELGVVLDAACDLLGHDVDPAAFEPAIDRGLLSVAGDRPRFPHPVTRSAIVQKASLAEVVRADRSLARTLAGRPHLAVWHEAQATWGADEDLARRLEESAAEAERGGRPAEALRRLERAARLTPGPGNQARRFIAAGTVAYEMGRPDAGRALLETARRTDGNAAEGALADGTLHRYAARPRRTQWPVAQSCASARLHRQAGRFDAALQTLVSAAHSMFWSGGDPAERRRLASGFAALPESVRGMQYLAALSAAEPAAAAGPARAWLDAEGIDDPKVLRRLAIAAVNLGDPVRAADLLTRAAEPLRVSGRLGLLTHVQGLHARIAATLGDWDNATLLASATRELAERSDQPLWHAHALATRAYVAALRGDTRRAVAGTEHVERRCVGQRVSLITMTTQMARGVVLLSGECWDDAYAVFLRLVDRSSPDFHPQFLPEAATFLAECATAAGRSAEVRTLLPGISDDNPAAELCVAASRAMLSDSAFDQVANRDLGDWPWLRARLELAHGAWLRRRRQNVAARTPLRAAREGFELLRAEAWARRATAELRAAGVGTEATPDDTAAALSPQELAIARLAAAGLSNRQIGQQLFLSPRTIGSHLYRIFPKLGITSRGQLSARLPST